MRSLQWRPYMLTKLSVSCQSDLLAVVMGTAELQQHTRRQLPLLMDMDPHYRLSKMLYCESFVHLDVRSRFSQLPLLYGVCLGEPSSVIVIPPARASVIC